MITVNNKIKQRQTYAVDPRTPFPSAPTFAPAAFLILACMPIERASSNWHIYPPIEMEKSLDRAYTVDAEIGDLHF